MKAVLEIVRISNDIVTASTGIATCTIPLQPVEECDFEGEE